MTDSINQFRKYLIVRFDALHSQFREGVEHLLKLFLILLGYLDVVNPNPLIFKLDFVIPQIAFDFLGEQLLTSNQGIVTFPKEMPPVV
jgi:hypothetical protein